MAKRRVKREPVVQPLDQSIKLIPLTHGQVAIVDAADYEWLNQWTWIARWSPTSRSFYADRKDYSSVIPHTIPMHRQLLGLDYGDPRQGDHIASGRTLDNRRSNLRIASHGQNSQNSRLRSHNHSGFKGVKQHHNKWTATIRINNRRIYLGLFSTPEEAHEAYCGAALKYHGEFARFG